MIFSVSFIQADTIENELTVIKTMLENEMYDVAIDQLNEIISKNAENPNLETAHFFLAECLYLTQNTVEAEKNYLIIYNSYKKSVYFDKVLYRLGLIYLTKNKHSEAAAFLNELMINYPKSELTEDVPFYLGVCYEKLNDYKKAAEFYKVKASKNYLDPFFFQSCYSLGLCLFQLEDYDNAIKYFEETKSEKKFGDAYYYIGKCYEKLKQFDKAKKNYDKIPETADYYKSIMYSNAWMSYDSGDKLNAAGAFLKYYDKYPDDKLAATALLTASDIYFNADNFEKASELFEKYYSLFKGNNPASNPDIPKVLYFAGYSNIKIFEKNKNADYLKKAEYLLLELLSIPAQNEFTGKAFFRLGYIYGLQSKQNEAIKYYSDFIDKYPADAFLSAAIYEISKLYFEKKEFNQVIKYLNLFLEKFPDHELAADARLSLAETYYQNKDWKEAAEHFAKILIFPTDNSADDNLYYKTGWAYMNMQDTKKALEYFEKLTVKFPKSGLMNSALNQISKIYLDSGDMENARKYLALLGKDNITASDNSRRNFAYVTSLKADKDAQDGNIPSALNLYSEALKAYIESGDTQSALAIALKKGDMLFSRRQFDVLEKFYGELISAPDAIADIFYIYHGLGWTYYEEKKYEKSNEFFKKFIESVKSKNTANLKVLREEAYFLSALNYRSAGQAENHYAALNEYLDSFDQNSKYYQQALFDKAAAAKKLGKTNDAIESYKKFISIFKTGTFYTDAILNLIELSRETKNTDDVLNLSRTFLKEFPDDSNSISIKFLLLKHFSDIGDDTETLFYASELIAKHPEQMPYPDDIFFISAKILEKNGDKEKARIYFDKIFSDYKQSERMPETLYSLGLYYESVNNADSAIFFFARLVESYPRHLRVYETFIKLGNLLFQKKDFKNSAEILQKFLDNYEIKDFELVETMYKLAVSYLSINETSKALEVTGKALKKYDELLKTGTIQNNDISASLCILSGDIHFQNAAYSKAIFEYQRVVAFYNFKNFVDSAQFKTAQCYAKMQKNELAKKILNKILTDFPDTPLKQDIENLITGL